MKKRDLLFAGLLLAALPAFAQPDLSDPRSAKVVFTQDFEKSWTEFTTTAIDSITELQYYTNTGKTNSNSLNPWEPANAGNWQKGPIRRDSIIKIYNGEMVVIDDGERNKGDEVWLDDKPESATILTHAAGDASELRAYGEADGGGNLYFQFTSDSCTKNSGNGGAQAYSRTNGLAARYRRNLFVRLNPGDITENSSYRLTFYVKAKKVQGKEEDRAIPTVYADVMRGYYHSEKPFSMGYISNDATNHPYEYSNTFEYTKNDFDADNKWDNWEKVVFMTYYTTDSIAEYFVFKDGYWWAEDNSWKWAAGSKISDAPNDTVEKDLYYIVQPDKYFVRLGLSSDWTVFSLDNISLIRSWIGGCEYNKDKMRVNFGYKTNLKDLVAAEKKAHGYDQIELDASTFDVWCKKIGQNWFKMPMRSAEYHADGYMYLFTDFYEDEETHEEMPYEFQNYDSVYVTFRNPVDPAIQLLYTDAPFPKGNDSLWIKGDTALKVPGKVVPDFVNEVAIPNPTASIWKGVYSKYDLPPVMLHPPYDEGSFGLESVETLEFKFSRKIAFDNKQASNKTIAYVGDERWGLSWRDADSTLILTRNFEFNTGAKKNQPMAGDYEIQITQLSGIGTEVTDDVIFHYHFGSFDRDAAAATIKTSDWRSEIKETGAWDRPMPASLWCYEAEDGFYGGEGYNYSPYKKCGLYKMVDDGINGDALFYLSGRTNGKYGSLYTVETLQKGAYTISFSSFGWSRQNDIKVYVYAKPSEMKYDALKGAKIENEKSLIGTYKPGYQTSWDGNDTEKEWNAKVERFSFTFSIATPGDYVIEWETPKEGSQSYYGVAIGNYSLSSGCVSTLAFNLNNAVAAAETRVAAAKADEDLYGGDALAAAEAAITEYKTGGAFDAAHTTNQTPKVWVKATSDVKKTVDDLAARISTVDALQTKIDDANTKVDGLSADYKLFDVTAKLEALIDSATNKFPIPSKTNKNIEDLTKLINDAMTAVDNRVTKNNNFSSAIKDAEKLVAAKDLADIEEYSILVDTLAETKAFDAIQASDADVDKQMAKLQTAMQNYSFKVEGVKAPTERLRALRALARNLEIDAVDTLWALSNFVDTVQTDNDEIADIYKAAIKYEIYNLLATSAIDDPIDVTPLIKNYNLYSVATVTRDANSGDPIVKQKHPYSNDSIYVFPLNKEFDNALPGWTAMSVPSNSGSNNRMATCDDGDFTHFKAGVPVFDGKLTIDWNSKAELKTVIENIPSGYYALGVELVQYSDNSNIPTTLTALTTVDTLKVTAKSGAKGLEVDSITVLNDTMAVDLWLGSGNGRTAADNFSLLFLGGHKSITYSALVAGAKADLENKIATRSTFVNAPVAAGARVEYFTLGGMKVAAPKSGEIVIRKTTKNGKVVVDKVLVK